MQYAPANHQKLLRKLIVPIKIINNEVKLKSNNKLLA